MSRRRVGALKPKTVINSIVVCAAISLAGIGYVWAKTQVWALGKEMKTLELHRDELKRSNEALRRTYAGMCTHERLAARVKELQLGLVAPTPSQMVRLTEPLPGAQARTENHFYAARKE